MTKNESTRTCIYIDQKLLSRCDAALSMTDANSRSEFICHALEHYLSVLNMQSNSKVLTPALESVIGGKIAGTEDRISRSIFKLAVEMAMMNHILAAVNDIDPKDLDSLRQLCVQQVARLGGRYRLEDAVDFQNGGT